MARPKSDISSDRRDRSRAPFRAAIGALAALGLVLSALPAAAKIQPVDFIEGVWELSGCSGYSCVEGFVRIQPGGDGLEGTAFTDVRFTGPDNCTHEEGLTFWDIFPAGAGRYEGTHSGFFVKDGECEIAEAWLATWTFDPDDEYAYQGEFCSKLADPSVQEWKCWDIERYRSTQGTRSFGATAALDAKGHFVSDKHFKPKGYRKTKAEAPALLFDLMWHPGNEKFYGDHSLLGLTQGGGEMSFTDVLGKGDERRTERTVYDLAISRGSSFPLPDEDGAVKKWCWSSRGP